MKKFLIATVCIIVGVTGVLALVQPSNLDYARSNLSEVRENVFTGQTPEFSATIMSGRREGAYDTDGVANRMVDFSILVVKFKTPTNELFGTPIYKITINDAYCEGELQQNPFDQSYIASAENKIDKDSQIYLMVQWGQMQSTTKMELQGEDWLIDWSRALDLAIGDIRQETFDNFIRDGQFLAEVHIQMVGDPAGQLDKFYWYVTVYGRDGSRIIKIIEPETGIILTPLT